MFDSLFEGIYKATSARGQEPKSLITGTNYCTFVLSAFSEGPQDVWVECLTSQRVNVTWMLEYYGELKQTFSLQISADALSYTDVARGKYRCTQHEEAHRRFQGEVQMYSIGWMLSIRGKGVHIHIIYTRVPFH